MESSSERTGNIPRNTRLDIKKDWLFLAPVLKSIEYFLLQCLDVYSDDLINVPIRTPPGGTCLFSEQQ